MSHDQATVETRADRLVTIHALLDELTSSPWSHDVLELAMAVAVSLEIAEKDESALVWLLIVGAPSSDKTFAVLLLKSAECVYYLDSATENFIASGYKDPKGQRAPDIFKELDGKAVVIKELGTVFSMRPDKVRKFLGDLLAIYDREYHKVTGTVGAIHGKAAFSIVACVTPAAIEEHQEYMAKIGPRFLIYRPPQLTEVQEDEGLDLGWDTTGRKDTIVALRALVTEHLAACVGTCLEPETPKQQDVINRLAKLVAYGRTLIRRQRGSSDPDLIQREGPFRLQQQLRNLARALAIVHGRSRVTAHELELVRRVALGSLPTGRADVLVLIPSHPEGLSVKACATGIDKSEDRARQLLDDLVRIKLLTSQKGVSDGGRPETIYVPVVQFADLLRTPIKPLDHMLNLHATDFTDDADNLDCLLFLEKEHPSGQSHRKSPEVRAE